MNRKDAFWMIAACLLLIGAGVLAITLFEVPSGNVLWVGFLLLCPLMHFLMMRNMHQSEDHSMHTQNNERREP